MIPLLVLILNINGVDVGEIHNFDYPLNEGRVKIVTHIFKNGFE